MPAPASVRHPDLDWCWALRRIAAVFIGTRLLVLAIVPGRSLVGYISLLWLAFAGRLAT